MGKPFEGELGIIKDVYGSFDISSYKVIENFVFNEPTHHIIAVGSGGSFSAAQLFSSLCHKKGLPAVALTPFELLNYGELIVGSKVIFISASGSNKDIIISYERTLEFAPKSVLNVIMNKSSPLEKLSVDHNITTILSRDLISGKDGFLATNSLIAYFGLFLSAFCEKYRTDFDLERLFNVADAPLIPDQYLKIDSFCVLHGALSKAVAVDLESKFNEAALGNVAISDFRNFGHGRHHWFAKRKEETVLVILITPEDKELAYKTISKLPHDIKLVKLESYLSDGTSIIDLLYKSFHLVNQIGKARGIDPGRPHVPKFGRELYNLNYKNLFVSTRKQKIKNLALYKKINSCDERNSKNSKEFWHNQLNHFCKKLSHLRFGVLALDYDGTLCSIENRFNGMSGEITKAITNVLEKGFIVCVVTGRGKSVRNDLQSKIPKNLWDNIIVGYYNGADIGYLSNNSVPNPNKTINPELEIVYKALLALEGLTEEVDFTIRPNQLTIEAKSGSDWGQIIHLLKRILKSFKLNPVKILNSSHSIDIIPSTVSKLSVILFCEDAAKQRGIEGGILAIGDKGKYPGNDFELLSHEYSLSVDEVSDAIDSCWNLAPLGLKNERAALYYFSKLIYLDHHMKIIL